MKSSTMGTFLLGATFGVGVALLSLYTRKPGCVAQSIDTIAEMGRRRIVKERELRFRRNKLKEMGFMDEEIDEIAI